MVQSIKDKLRSGWRIPGLTIGMVIAILSFYQAAMRDMSTQFRNLEQKMSRVLVAKEDRETSQLRTTYLERNSEALEKQLNEVKAELHEHGDKLSEIEIKLSAILTTLDGAARHARNP